MNSFFFLDLLLSFPQVQEVLGVLSGNDDNVDVWNFEIEVCGKRSEYLDGDLGDFILESCLDLVDDVNIIGLLELVFLFNWICQADYLLLQI